MFCTTNRHNSRQDKTRREEINLSGLGGPKEGEDCVSSGIWVFTLKGLREEKTKSRQTFDKTEAYKHNKKRRGEARQNKTTRQDKRKPHKIRDKTKYDKTGRDQREVKTIPDKTTKNINHKNKIKTDKTRNVK